MTYIIMIVALIRVRPFVSLIDETVRVCVSGLLSRQKVTLRAKLTGDRGERFESSAHYIADEHGTVSVSSQPSVGGSYTGIEPMGLLWSMKHSPGQRKGIRLQKRDVTKPYVVNLDVFDGHLRLGGENYESVGEPLSSGTFEKWYMKDGVKRIPVREGRIRGTLFLPPGDGPFPGILDFYGAVGGLSEEKGSLLASHGFAALSLAFFAYDDLPKLLKDVDYAYFEEAAEWMAFHPKISPQGIGAISVSSGSEFLFMLALHKINLIKAIVAVSPFHCFVFGPCHYKGEQFSRIELDYGLASRNEHGYTVYKDSLVYDSPTNQENSTAIMPVDKILCPMLFVFGKDDLNSPTEYMVKRIMKRMKEHHKEEQCTCLGYPGAGHLIGPPYTPLCNAQFIKHPVPGFCAWGGQTKAHAIAQEDSWRKILNFLHKHLPEDRVMSSL